MRGTEEARGLQPHRQCPVLSLTFNSREAHAAVTSFNVVRFINEHCVEAPTECSPLEAWHRSDNASVCYRPSSAKGLNQPILKEINAEYSLEGLMLKLKLRYFGHLMRRTNLLEKTLVLGKLRAGGKGGERMRWLDGITDSMDIIEQTPKRW